MAIETGLAHTTLFSESMNIKAAPSVEQTPEEQAQEAKIPEQTQDRGDTVSISIEARALSAAAKNEESDTEADSDVEQRIEQLQKQIDNIEKDIKELQQDEEMPEKEKLQQIQAKQAELMQLEEQLMKAQEEQLKAQGYSSGGGTRAEGFGNSVADF
ncbi:FlxA-like family protein [Pseudodesulfovibrio sp.]|uniref:FlxA-like family protein n=1 Tax=Pseudodesulfovibrio sp. TaxID=2035812 RepID=UPI0026293CB6|nr:FlxA-like family protein [Pseudodesulfovibrio sp.]MDD3313167.1 FlxA-like family protein [Pseudodesulfovibrio sp.]